MAKSLTQKVATLSVTAAELYMATSCAQDMLFVWQMMQAMQLKVKITMTTKVLSTYLRTGVQEVGH